VGLLESQLVVGVLDGRLYEELTGGLVGVVEEWAPEAGQTSKREEVLSGFVLPSGDGYNGGSSSPSISISISLSVSSPT